MGLVITNRSIIFHSPQPKFLCANRYTVVGMMGIVFKLVLLILMLCPLTINSSFQYLTFVQQWPKGYCTVNPSRCQRIPLPTVFTIHGLWPGNFTKILQICTTTSYTQLQVISIGLSYVLNMKYALTQIH